MWEKKTLKNVAVYFASATPRKFWQDCEYCRPRKDSCSFQLLDPDAYLECGSASKWEIFFYIFLATPLIMSPILYFWEIRTQRAVVASRRATNLASRLPKLPFFNFRLFCSSLNVFKKSNKYYRKFLFSFAKCYILSPWIQIWEMLDPEPSVDYEYGGHVPLSSTVFRIHDIKIKSKKESQNNRIQDFFIIFAWW